MRIDEIQLDRYGPLAGVSHEPAKGLEVVYGPNEAGKTLLLEGVCRLFAPESAPLFGEMDRVERDPVGAVTVSRDGETTSYDGEASLLDDTRLTPGQLRNVFVIRDSDLRLRDEHAFYDSVTEQIGDLHTAELDALEGIVKEQGRLTDRTLSLSSAAEHDDAGTVRDDAVTLAEDLRAYVAEAREDGIEEAERRRLQVARDLRQRRQERDRQETAATLHEHRDLAETLDTYRAAVSALAESAVSEDELAHLRTLDRERREAEREAERVETDLDETRSERQAEQQRLRELESELEGYRARQTTVEEVRDQLAAVAGDEAALGRGRLRQFTVMMAAAGLLGGGVAAGLGATLVGLGLVAVGLAAAGGWLLLHRQRTARERERAAVVAAAQNAALPVEGFADVRPAVETFQQEFRRLEREREATEERVDHLASEVEDLTEDRDATRARVREASEELEASLDAADCESVEAYAAAVEERQRLAGERDRAAAVLESRLPPAVDDATPGERAEAWAEALTDLVADVDAEGVEPDAYDPERLSALETEVEELRAEREELAETLADHEDRLDRFAEQLRDIRAEPFREERLDLPARSLDGLLAAAADLESLVERIEREADVAREAVDVLDAVRADEEDKIAALFGADGRAGAVLATITDGRYTDVRYDADDRTLRVRRGDGEWLTPEALSHGTAEQLYLAARVSLAEQLLDHRPGFFLLDDPFLPADRERLERGFEVLQDLAASGWQLLYFTAKPEVGEEMVETHDLPVRRLDERL